jgi:hypothetical protein
MNDLVKVQVKIPPSTYEDMAHAEIKWRIERLHETAGRVRKRHLSRISYYMKELGWVGKYWVSWFNGQLNREVA